MELVSIITVCYNSEKTIRRTIESVYKQTYENIEYIIIDGNSTDSTMQIVNEYKPIFGERLKVVSEPDKGIYDAMNKGINLSNGTIIGIINSDDYYEKNAVELVVRNMSSEKYQFIYGMLRFIRDNKVNYISLVTPNFLELRPMNHPSCFVSKAIYEDYGMFDLQYKYAADYDFCYRLKNIQEIKFIPVYEILANFTEGGASSSYQCDLEALRFKKNNKIISNFQYVLLYGRRLLGHLLGF